MDDQLRQAPIGVIEATADGRVTDANETAASALATTTEALVGTDVRESFPQSAAGAIRDAFDGESPTPASFEEYYPRIERWLDVDVRVADGVLVFVRDCTSERERAETVDRLERRLERVQRIDSLVATVLRRVIGASAREDVARTLCEGLGGTDLYEFAWVGVRDFPSDRLRTLASGGSAPGLADDLADSSNGERTLPEEAAIETGETRHARTIADDESVPREIRRAAFGHGLQSCLAVPLAYQGTVYGVVSVYSGQEDGFSEGERRSLETLGGVAGFAIRAIRQEDLLVADTVTEVTLAVRDETTPFVRAAREAGCELSLDGAVPRGDGAVVCYLGTDGAINREREGDEHGEGDNERDGDGLLAAVDGAAAVTDARWIRSDGDPLLQATVTERAPVAALASWGATVSSAEYTANSARIVAEAPPEGDVRRMVEAVDATVDETSLVAKEEATRDPEAVEAFRDALDERLTDRQRTVLRTAYHSDYFESPRGSTSAEVAETLDIAGSTMLYHLRRAQQKLVAAFFAADGEPTADP